MPITIRDLGVAGVPRRKQVTPGAVALQVEDAELPLYPLADIAGELAGLAAGGDADDHEQIAVRIGIGARRIGNDLAGCVTVRAAIPHAVGGMIGERRRLLLGAPSGVDPPRRTSEPSLVLGIRLAMVSFIPEPVVMRLRR